MRAQGLPALYLPQRDEDTPAHQLFDLSVTNHACRLWTSGQPARCEQFLCFAMRNTLPEWSFVSQNMRPGKNGGIRLLGWAGRAHLSWAMKYAGDFLGDFTYNRPAHVTGRPYGGTSTLANRYSKGYGSVQICRIRIRIRGIFQTVIWVNCNENFRCQARNRKA